MTTWLIILNYLRCMVIIIFSLISDKRSNDVFVGERDGQGVFIKKYREHDGDSKSAKSRLNTEIDCYNNLPKENLLDLVEANLTDKYLVLKNTELSNIDKNEESVKEIVDLYLDKLAIINPSFLSEVNWGDYEKLFDKLKKLDHSGIISGADKYIKMFTDKKELIEKSKKVFTHHDFNFSNIKNDNGRLVIFDFEHASQDNSMYDPATLFIEIYGKDELRRVFENHINKSALFNKELFNLMLFRRCIDVMYGFKNNQEIPYFQKNKDAFNNIQMIHN